MASWEGAIRNHVADVLPLADRPPLRRGARGGMDTRMAKQLQELPKEDSRLQELVVDLVLGMLILQEAVRPS